MCIVRCVMVRSCPAAVSLRVCRYAARAPAWLLCSVARGCALLPGKSERDGGGARIVCRDGGGA